MQAFCVLANGDCQKGRHFADVAPITQGGMAARETGFTVTLMGSATRTQGVVLCDQTRTIDARARTYRRIGKAPPQCGTSEPDPISSIDSLHMV